MTEQQLKAMSDEEITRWIDCSEQELKDRAEKRRRAAIDQIRQIAGAAKLQVSIAGAGRFKSAKPLLRSGEIYKNPADTSQVYTVGKGKPPGWFVRLREAGKLTEAQSR